MSFMPLLRKKKYRPNHAGLYVSALGGPPTYTFTDAPAGQSPGSSTATFTAANIGTASAGRIVIVTVSTEGVVATGLTIGGVSATKAVEESTVVSGLQIWYANVPTGTTGDIVLTAGGSFSKAGIIVGYATGITATPTSTQTQGSTGSPVIFTTITVPGTGFAILASGTASTTSGWTGATQDGGVDLPSASFLRQANTTTTGAPQLAFGAGLGHGVAAAWGP